MHPSHHLSIWTCSPLEAPRHMQGAIDLVKRQSDNGHNECILRLSLILLLAGIQAQRYMHRVGLTSERKTVEVVYNLQYARYLYKWRLQRVTDCFWSR